MEGKVKWLIEKSEKTEDHHIGFFLVEIQRHV